MTRVLLAVFGTSHYAFPRLAEWLDDWLAGPNEVVAVIQHGATTPPRHGATFDMITKERVLRYLDEASVVVTHGGTGTIMEARAAGHVPVVIPRVAALGENVDDHQVTFARTLAERGWVHLAETETALRDHLDRACTDASTFRRFSGPHRSVPAAAAVHNVLVEVMRQRPGFVRAKRVGQLIRFHLRRHGR